MLGLTVAVMLAAPTIWKPTADGLTPTFSAGAQRSLAVVDGRLRLAGTTAVADGNHYFGVMIPLGGPHDLRDRALEFQAATAHPGATRAFYVRLYGAGDERPCWSFNSWSGVLGTEPRRFTMQTGFSPDPLVWEADVVEQRVADRVDRIELIIGTADDSTEISLLLGELRAVPRLRGIDDLTAPRAIARETPLAGATVLHPDSDAGRAAAGRIVAAVREKTGLELPSRPGKLGDRPTAGAVIALGSMASNPAIELLYARLLTPVDRLCPGAGGALVHTVGNPFGTGWDAIIVGAGDDAGLARAADLFIAALPDAARAVPRLFVRAYGEEFLKRFGWADDAPDEGAVERWLAAGRRALAEGAHTSVAGTLRDVSLRYQLTGDPHLARAYVALWELYAASATDDPSVFGGAWGFDSDFPSMQVVAGWDNIEEDPALTDGQRLQTTRHLARWLREAVLPSCAGAVDRVPHNHETFPGLGALFAGLYFSAHYDVLEGRAWLAVADRQFGAQSGFAKPYEDCNGYQWLTNGHLFRYACARPDFVVFENGNAQKIIDYCLGNMDNLGYQAPYGDTGSWQCWNNELLCLDIHAHRTGDSGAAWAADLKRRTKNSVELYGYQGEPRATPPEGFGGARVWPLDATWYRTWPDDPRPPLAACFDKVSFRESFDAAGPYLLLDGLNLGGHKHADGNSLPRLTWFERIWLADNDYYKAQPKYHNSLLVFRDGEATPIPGYAELMGAGQTPRYAYSRSRLRGWAGCDWDRTVVWLKAQRAFLVLDRVVALSEADYTLRLLWHGVGRPTLTDDGLLLEQGGPTLWLQTGAGPDRRLTDDAELGANWAGYPHAEPIVRTLANTARVHLPAGGSYLFATLLHGRGAGPAAPWTLRWLDEVDGVVLQREAEQLAVALGPFSVPTPVGQAATDAQAAVLDDAGVTLFDARNAEAAGVVGHQSEQPVDVDVAVPLAGTVFGQLPLRAPTATTPVGQPAPALETVWDERYQPPDGGEALRPVCLAARPRDDSRIYVGTAEGWVFAVNVTGGAFWSKPLGSRILDLAIVDIDGDGRDEVAVGRQDHRLTLLDDDGVELWSKELEYYRRPPEVNIVRAGDIDGDGRPEIIVGGNNWRFYAFDREGRERWHFETVHPARSGEVADIDGDGAAEVLAGTHYYWSSTLRGDGSRAWQYRLGPICYDIATARLGDGPKRGIIYGGGDGLLHVVDADGKPLLRLDTGDELRQVAAADLDGDGRDEVLGASQNENLFCLGPDLVRRWRLDLGEPPTALATVPGAAVVGTAEGRLLVVGADGRVTGQTTLSGPIVTLTAGETTVTAATADGHVTRVRVR